MKQIMMLLAAVLLTCCSSDCEVNAQNNTTMTEKLYITIDGQAQAGESNISVTLSLAKPTGIRGLSSAPSPNDDENYYTLNGQKVSNPSKGLFIKNGKKIVL